MKWEFHEITNSFTKEDFFKRAFVLYQGMPKILQTFAKYKVDDEKSFLDEMGEGLNYVGFENGKFFGLIHGEHKTESAVEGHLFCVPGTNIDLLSTLVTYSKNKALEKYYNVVTTVVKKHKSLHKVMNRSGFIDTGYRSWPFVYKGTPVEVIHYVAGR